MIKLLNDKQLKKIMPERLYEEYIRKWLKIKRNYVVEVNDGITFRELSESRK